MKSDLYPADSQLRQLKLLFHALRLPMSLYYGSRLLYALPINVKDERLLIEQTEVLITLRRRLQNGRALFVPQRANKGYIGLKQDEDGLLLLGPFIKIVQENSTDGTGSIFAGKSNLVTLNEDNIFYIIALLEEYFSKPFYNIEKNNKNADKAEKTIEPPEPELYGSMSSFFSHPPYFLEQELSLAIKGGNLESALNSLHEINRLQRAKVAGDPVRSLKNSLIGSCALCSRAAISGGLTADTAFALADSYIRSIEENNSLKELSELEEKMVIDFSKRVEALRRDEVSNLVLGAMRYIDECLSEKLRLPDIAAQVFIHPDYLSSLFKKETGETVTRYIQKRRVQEACRFLRYSNFPIADIAGYFQFSSQSAFTKIFKQFQNLTPKQYRVKSPNQF